MNKVAVILANGFEEIEALSVVDILRRAQIDTVTVGLDRALVTGSHGIAVQSDILLSELNEIEFDMIVLPGGLPGATNLAKSEELCSLLRKFDDNAKLIAAVCAAPMALEAAGVLKQKFTCYPGFESSVRANKSGYTSDKKVVFDHNIITSCGPAMAMEFALELVKELKGIGVYESVMSELLYDRL
ncbi:DJ-1/PfpI family protein [Campylobacter sp. RM9344]|uniref:DJ-1/PfpI family protein n=1 Tax=Campylobacter californiensis TaxID=1032243 RepID=A0AAW3ZWA8_9BACT|nr:MULTISPECIES: DJ-1 family glyoxalase III [unclassified Campylobacter]MBE2984751.1 DJ-1/PfpI family protein [Campylobacter sp. RM6883]MBE2986941.1 DJ-1/PfpI family protein [Campylobacter sp. RM12919]MBE2987771.1 DJ-1/PfpI family protein [Campylobacter sp. RM12920]MBE2994667.1 DJ-1/PfpI family protein [Campylobacter sp. RM6913]MBE3029193.1 DJ-1/PfpI family protein [Campylobacter sp. RM9344]